MYRQLSVICDGAEGIFCIVFEMDRLFARDCKLRTCVLFACDDSVLVLLKLDESFVKLIGLSTT